MKKSKLSVKLIAFTLVMVLMCSFLVTGCDDETAAGAIEGNPVVTMVVKDYGTIKLELYPDIAPITVENFVSLVEDGFYNGLIFHRVIENFMIQGGDPTGTGMGGSDKDIKGEFKVNGVENTLKHTRGVISMARNGYSYDSASSQFFIVHKTSAHLDGQYAAFGMVIEGMDVVDKIAVVDTDSSDRPNTDVVIESVTVDTSTYTRG